MDDDAHSSPVSPLRPCPTCGAMVLMGVYNHDGHWRAFPEPLSPVFGTPHQCPSGSHEEEGS